MTSYLATWVIVCTALVACCGREEIPERRQINIDPRLRELTSRILREAEEQGVGQGHMPELRSILVVSSYEDPIVLGQCEYRAGERRITVREDVVTGDVFPGTDLGFLELVLRHEMGHCAWNLPHDNSHLAVMNAAIGMPHLVRTKQDPSKFEVRPELVADQWQTIRMQPEGTELVGDEGGGEGEGCGAELESIDSVQ